MFYKKFTLYGNFKFFIYVKFLTAFQFKKKKFSKIFSISGKLINLKFKLIF